MSTTSSVTGTGGPAPVPSLRVVTRRIADPGDLLGLVPANLPATAIFSWLRRGDGIVGWGQAARVDTIGADRFAETSRWWTALVAEGSVDDDVRRPGSGLVAFGSMAYSSSSPAGGTLVVPSVVVGRRGDEAWVTTCTPAGQPTPSVHLEARPAPASPQGVSFGDGSQTPTQWMGAVATAVSRINAGELDKCVLARDLTARGLAPLDTRRLLQRLSTSYPNTWAFSVDGLVGATPEMLVRLERGLITSRVLAGTIRRTGDDERDLSLAAHLARSSKDLVEHEFAVRSVADRLAPHCDSINVPESPFVLHLPNVMHLATDVAGVLSSRSTSLALAEALHPSAAVCGTPRDAAEALITELEHMDRGRYAGPVGWLSAGGDGEWGIALRSGAISPEDPREIRLFAGCGIVAGSDPAAELAESDAKLVPMRDALSS
ncbi:isochorismate synthase [Arsenicicoccus sp. MKL-02]|uniref:isochorismate synthase n=1 Tax=Arsenicicoccus cauae TaxID=2663847 RepID=A0A6I3IGA3_9MICO|nr:isochorismate synthase [Arsenicicoccus cauae]